MSYTECLRDAQSVVNVLAGYGHHATSIVVRVNGNQGIRYEMEGILTIEHLSREWKTLDIQLLAVVIRNHEILEWKIVNSAKDKRL